WRVPRPDAVGPGVAAADHDDMLAARGDLRCHRVAGNDAVLLRQELHREMNAVKVASGNGKIARRFGTSRHHDRVVFGQDVLGGHIVADFDVGPKYDAFDGHLRHPAVDRRLFHLEIGNAVTQEAANTIRFFVDHDAVTRARELLCTGEPGRTGAT